MKAKSVKGKTAAEIGNGIALALQEGFAATLAIVFISVEGELNAVRKILSDKEIAIFGASSGSEFVDGEIETESIVVLLLDLDRSKFIIRLLEIGTGTTTGAAEQLGREALNSFQKPSFLMVSGGLGRDGDEMVEGIEKSCGPGTVLYGGLAADNNYKIGRTYVFTNDTLTDNGLVALILDGDKVQIAGLAIGGWKPMGMERTITGSKGNVVYSIDHEPALDFITRYSGVKELLTNNNLLLLSSNFQLQLQRKDKHPVMRTPMHANSDDHSIVFAGSMPEGAKVKLCLLPGFEVIEEALREFEDYKSEQPEADALVMFSCAGRKLSLGPYVSDEINGVKGIWDAPMAGFFCYGEIGRVENEKIEFHNMTCSLAILKEKQS